MPLLTTDQIKAKAGALVHLAVKNGFLSTLDGSVSCVDCGKPAREYDHRDYARPLDVQPVCSRCNHLRGAGKVSMPVSSEPRPKTTKLKNGFEGYIAEVQKLILETALAYTNGIRTKAADRLGMSYRSFRHYAKKYDL